MQKETISYAVYMGGEEKWGSGARRIAHENWAHLTFTLDEISMTGRDKCA